MLSYRRPMGSRTENIFVREWIESLPHWDRDREDNIHVWVDRASREPFTTGSKVIWSCHTDTVHREGGKQRVHVGARRMHLEAGQTSNCLGADDTVGIWLMREMILAGTPGHYVFHFGEERGGIGSSAVVRNNPELFEGARAVIALDRRGTRDIITHQSYGRCCSDAFARSLAKLLRPAARYRLSDRGIYTDSAEYVDIIEECTNISVGYQHEHTPFEYVDYWHALRLCNVLCAFDESRLVFERDPWDNAWDDDDGRWKYDQRLWDRVIDTSDRAENAYDKAAHFYAMYSSKPKFEDLDDDDKQAIRDMWGVK